jgi:carboxypeptidase family protein/TonB-dependent receptor-like protein
MKRIVSFFTIAVALAVATTASAQVQTGSILVKATDDQGGVVPGVSVTISSPVLVAGSMTGVTDGGGVNRFPSLVPGTYAVKLELAGFQTITRENIVVLVGQTTPLDFSMKLASLAENITVTGASPTVDTTSANVAVNLSEQLIQGTPGGRDIWALVEAKVPGLVISRPDVGGTSGGLQGTFSARGTASAQNSSFLNGVNVGDPASIGAAGFYYDFDAFDDIQVSTGAHDITVPTSGVFLNMITKTGGNRWNGSTTFTWTGDTLQGRNDTDPTLQKYGFRPNGNTSDFVSDINVAAGGPVVRNKVRFFGSFRDWRVHQNVPVQNSQSVLDQTNITSGLGNATWQVNRNNRVTGFYSRQRYSKPNRLLNAQTVTVPESTVDEEDMFDLAQGLWNSVLGKNFFIDARVGINKILFPTYFNGGNNQSVTDNATGIIYGNNRTEVIRNRDRFQANATAQYYVDQALGGRHEFKFGFDRSHAVTKNETHRIDDVDPRYDSSGGRATVELFATPQNDATALNVVALFAQDSYSVNRLTVTGGVRYEHLEGYLPSQGSPPSRFAALGIGGFATQSRSFSEVRDIVKWNTAGPRLSAIYDVTGDGRTAAKASAGRYYYVLSTGGGGVSNVNPNSNYSELYTWNDVNADRKFQIGEQSGEPVITSVINPATGQIFTSIDPGFSRPYTDEYSFGVDRELMPSVKLSAVYTYRREKNTQASANPDNPYATTLTSAVDPGLDGFIGTADDGTYGFYQRISAANRTLITNDPNVLQSYQGLEITVTKRFTNRWQMLAGYTRSKNQIENVSVDVSPNFLINMNGNISIDAALAAPASRCSGCGASNADKPNQFKLTGMYILPWQELIISGNYSGVSGPPLTRQINRALAIGGAQTINLEPLGSHRLDFQNRIDLRVGKMFKFANTRTLEATLDFDNLTNASWVWQARSLTPSTSFLDPSTGTRQTLTQFLSPSAILPPRTVVLRAAFRF